MLRAFGEVLDKFLRYNLRPESAADRLADGTADSSSDVEEGDGDGNLVVRYSHHDGDLLNIVEHSACHSTEDLDCDQRRDWTTGMTEHDQQTSACNLNGNGDDGSPFVGIGILHRETDDDCPGTRNNVEDVGNVSGLGDRKLEYDLKV